MRGKGHGVEWGAMREIVLQACMWAIVACAGLSAWPFRFARRWKSWNLYLPVLGLGLYGLYEVALPAEVDVRRQMQAIVPLLLFMWINGIAKVAVLAKLQERAGGSRRRLRAQPQRRWQVMLALPVALGCMWWFWSTAT